MRAREIEIRIDELVLHGFSTAHRLRIGAAMQRELTRLFVERGLSASLMSGGAQDVIDAGSFACAPHATPIAIGGQIAGAIYSGLGR